MKIRKIMLILTLIILSGTAFAGEKSAGLAMLLSVIPGGGQFYTEHYMTGSVIAGGEIALGYLAYKYHTEAREDSTKYASRNSVLWWGFFLFGYSLADAYVSAKMYGFDVQTDINKVSLLVYRRL
jgi:hypothetical protein